MNTKTVQTSDALDGGSLAIQSKNVRFCWPGQASELTFPDIHLPRAQHLFLHGPSGTGKSTLLGLLAGLQAPASGRIDLLGRNLGDMRAGQRDRFRADHIGVIFQQFNLVPYLSALDNAILPCRLSPLRQTRAGQAPENTARELLKQLAVPEEHWHRNVTKLSIGQQQRVAAARALMGNPEIILADEPTSALDANNRDRFLDLLLTLAARHNSSVVFVSHDQALAGHFHNQMTLEADS
ncbi:ATP-binding cassette domain-containing protein [Marinobacter daepoensis]|uniref:ATP-binding cassette domain-containing protein n=1 Tax=Marinobacter daepoensis TaxID=262077 RepID=UPI0003F68755|nr:ATP-binding cassette domain-containing protein [Marinobacter daepoensis]MBY6033924.1 ATP-binding cassette domain-containing protein [Marinobacter daepoensis]